MSDVSHIESKLIDAARRALEDLPTISRGDDLDGLQDKLETLASALMDLGLLGDTGTMPFDLERVTTSLTAKGRLAERGAEVAEAARKLKEYAEAAGYDSDNVSKEDLADAEEQRGTLYDALSKLLSDIA